jgi:hypothetical protein
MVFFVGVWFVGSRGRMIMGVRAWYSENFGNYLHFKAYGAAGLTFRLDYSFDIDLFVPSYVPVTPMPAASIENEFRLILDLEVILRGGDILRSKFLINESFGYISASNSHYRVGLGDQDGYCFDYEVKIPPKKKKKAELSNYGCCGSRSPILSPTSLLF